jgi:hypothetical protein
MRKDFKTQKNEVKNLHKKYEEYLNSEYAGRDYSLNLSNPDNFIDGIYYHQAKSKDDRNNIIQNGFDLSKVKKSNCGAGRGLYLGRDKWALINFYSDNLDSQQDFALKIKGNFNFLDLLDDRNFLCKNRRKIEEKVLSLGCDGIRYYDPDATGEEFVLFNYKKAIFY